MANRLHTPLESSIPGYFRILALFSELERCTVLRCVPATRAE